MSRHMLTANGVSFFFSLLLSRPPKFIPLTELALLTRVAPLAFRTKS